MTEDGKPETFGISFGRKPGESDEEWAAACRDMARALEQAYAAQRIEAGTDETRNAAQPVGQEPDGEADAPSPYNLNQGPTHER